MIFRYRTRLIALTFVVLVAFFGVHPELFASEILSDLATTYQSATGTWAASLFPLAKRLFLTLATIQIIWSVLWLLIERSDPNQILADVLKKSLGLMFFWTILLNFDSWIPAIIDGFADAGARTANLVALTPTTVFDHGLELATRLIHTFSDMGMLDASINKFLIGAVAALGILLSFVIIAGQMLVTLVESYICVSGGVIFLGFAGSKWTAQFAEKYLSYCVSIGVKLFFTYLVIGAGTNLTPKWLAMIQTNMEVAAYLEILAGAVIYMFLTWQIPSIAGSMISGTVSLTLGNAVSTGATIAAGAGAAVGAAAGVATAGAATTASNVLGAAKMASAAYASTRSDPSSSSNGGSQTLSAIGAVGKAAASAAGDSLKAFGEKSMAGRLGRRLEARNAAQAESGAAGQSASTTVSPPPPSPPQPPSSPLQPPSQPPPSSTHTP